MDKLRKVIEEYGRWAELSTYVERKRESFRSYGAVIHILFPVLQRCCSYGANSYSQQIKIYRVNYESRRDETFVANETNTNPSSVGAKQKR